MPPLPNELSYLIEFIDKLVVPLTMVWFVFNWFWLLEAPEKEREKDKLRDNETEAQRKSRVEADRKTRRKTDRATAKGLGSGMVLAVLLLFFLYTFVFKQNENPPQNAMQISPWAAWVSCIVGLLIGGLVRVVELTKVKNALAKIPWLWGCIVTVSTALGLASLAIYYAGPVEPSPHYWLLLGYVSLLFTYRFAFLFGD